MGCIDKLVTKYSNVIGKIKICKISKHKTHKNEPLIDAI